MLQRFPETQAVICVSDLSAFGALTECQRRGIAVPGAMEIAGFGNYDVASVCVPALSTIDPHPRRIGAETARLILSLREMPSPPQTISIAPTLILRGSTS